MSHAKLLSMLAAGLLAAFALAASPAPVAGQEPSAVADEAPRTARPTLARPRREALTVAKGSQGWWTGTAAMVVILGAAGVLCIAVRRQAEGATGGRLKVLGRVSLPPKHAVFLVKAGGRTLLIGTGPQGAPSLLGELDDDDDEASALASSPVVARSDSGMRSARPVHAAPRIDVRLGDES
ncbi:MAG: flagellar biosynthetic protein FliO [Paludisphaera borealis]|uniref:flagellar biosynthetic protein FliO n=1 Tax=Paludisphaera borealis TaxID=1387353 RepID=UPI00284A3C4E|nr:flagellar biosynthetic protein FliO [Paludisphaera borealis]MDR3620939.1 flagellar biosynthetic protein FliO [Paludisphaera borealis]